MSLVWRKLVLLFLIFGLGVLLVFSMLGLIQDSKTRAKMFEDHGVEIMFSSEDKAQLDGNIGDEEMKLCRERASYVIAWLDPFLVGLDKVTIHARLDLRRGLASDSKIWIRCINDLDEFENVLIHEIGHIVDINYLSGDGGGLSKFSYKNEFISLFDPSVDFYSISFNSNEKIIDEAGFLTGYSQENVFEDFAETFLMYIKYPVEFRLLAQDNNLIMSKYNFMRDNVFDGYDFEFEKPLNAKVYSLYLNENKLPYDGTKLFKG